MASSRQAIEAFEKALESRRNEGTDETIVYQQHPQTNLEAVGKISVQKGRIDMSVVEVVVSGDPK